MIKLDRDGDIWELAAEMAGKDRRTVAEHKRLLYGEAIRALLG